MVKSVGRLLALVFLVGLLCSPLPMRAAHLEDEDKVTLTPPSPEIETAGAKALKGCPPTSGKKIRAGINKNGTYTLVGDLFGDGNIVAVVDLHECVALCAWRKGRWESTAVFNADTAWKYPGWDREEAIREPEATKPFWMLALDKHPLLVIASTEAKAGQNYFVILFDERHRRVSDLGYSFGSAPMVKDGYLITADASRVKSEWGATYFSRIENGKFVEQKKWEEHVPYNQPDPSEIDGDASYCAATSKGRTYTIMRDYSKSEHPADWVIFDGKLKDGGWRGILDAWKTQKVWAKVYVTPRKMKAGAPFYVEDWYENAEAYFFEKLIGLPRRLYDLSNPSLKRANIETSMKIEVTGDQEAVELLSTRVPR